jgi:hypothetical protein
MLRLKITNSRKNSLDIEDLKMKQFLLLKWQYLKNIKLQ